VWPEQLSIMKMRQQGRVASGGVRPSVGVDVSKYHVDACVGSEAKRSETASLTEIVQAWREHSPKVVPLPIRVHATTCGSIAIPGSKKNPSRCFGAEWRRCSNVTADSWSQSPSGLRRQTT
jgi:hypothetical protein